MQSWSEHISSRQIKYLTVGGMAWFYFWQYLFRPWRAARSVYRLARSRPKTMLERTVDGLIRNFVKGRKRGVADVEVSEIGASRDGIAVSAVSER